MQTDTKAGAKGGVREFSRKRRLMNQAVVGVRPELAEILDGPAEGSIEAEVYSVMPAGSETTIYLEAGGERILSKQNGLKQYSPDQKVWLRINPDKMNVFSKDSGKLAKLAVMDAQKDE